MSAAFGAMEERLESIAEMLGRAHRSGERRLRRIRERIEAGDRAGAAELLAAAEAEVAEHMVAEETTLFPVLTAASGGRADAAIAILRAEHAELRRLFAAVKEGRGGAAALRPLAELRRLFASHHRREEELCYPLTDELCPEPLKETVAKALAPR